MTSHEWITLTPLQGWAAFSRREELSEVIWDGLSETGGEWLYMNFTPTLSIWEAAEDGSEILMSYDNNNQLIELQVNPGRAMKYMTPLIERFGLSRTHTS